MGAIRDTPIVEGGQVVPGKQMYLTISADHRLADGHVEFWQWQEASTHLARGWYVATVANDRDLRRAKEATYSLRVLP